MLEKILKQLNGTPPEYLKDMGCEITQIDSEKGTCEMDFTISKRFCHSGDIVQGGFVTAMLDAVCTFAGFGTGKIIKLASLEVKVSFYEASRAGKFRAVGRVDRMGRTTAFLSGDLYNEAGQRTASITTTAKVSTK